MTQEKENKALVAAVSTAVAGLLPFRGEGGAP
jgi:hypothetical protein